MKISEKMAIALMYMKNVAYYEGRYWVSPTEIGYAINHGHSSVGSPVCKKMVELNLVERNEKGHYKLMLEQYETKED